MFFNEEAHQSNYFISRCDAKGVSINDTLYSKSILLSEKSGPRDWPVQSIDQLNEQHLDFDSHYEVILLGTGSSLCWPKHHLIEQWQLKHLPIEVMNTKMACQTYNVLTSDHRPVLAALIINP